MISWIQKYFHKHFRTVFAVMLALMIISLIGFYNASNGLGRGRDGTGGESVNKPYLGIDLANADQAKRLMNDANVSGILLGLNIFSEDQLRSYALDRHASRWLADQFHLPAPSKADLDTYVRSLRFFADRTTGQFDPKSYNAFLDQRETDPGVTRGDFTRVLVDDVRIAQIKSLLAGPGFLLPTEARATLELVETSWSVAVASVDYASFAPTLATPAAADLEKFFAANPARFTFPAQVRVDAIEFPSESFLAKVTVTDKELRAYYDLNHDDFTKPEPKTDAKPEPVIPVALAKPAESATAKADADFAAARPKVEEAFKLDRARRLAARAAAELTNDLFQQKIKPDTLAPVLAAHALALKPIAPFANRPAAPFTDLAMPATLGTELDTLAAAFRLSATQPFSDALPTSRGAVILVWRESIPARAPAFAEVRDRVAAEWSADEKQRLFAELGRTLHNRIEAALKAGTDFEQAVTDSATVASSAKLEAKKYSGFTLAQKRDSGSFDPLAPTLDRLETLQKGQLTEMITASAADGKTPESGLLVLAVDKKLPDLATPESLAMLRRITIQIAAYSAGTAIAELVQREFPKSALAEP